MKKTENTYDLSEENKKNKKIALDAAIAKLEKDYGKGAVMKLGDSFSLDVDRTSTGIMGLDEILGGGVPKGRIIEIYGPESSGKTTVALHMVAEIQKNGGIAGFIDAEHALDPKYAKNLGVNLDDLYISQPDSGEQALEIAETMTRSGALDIIVIDSVAALVPKAELDGDMGDSHMGLQARLMSQGLRKLTGIVSKTGCTLIFINQLRDKIGVMFGNPETTTGGKALKFYASIRLDVRRVESIKTGGEITANRIKIKVVKNKTAPPFKEALFSIKFGSGIDKYADMLDIAVNKNIVTKSGAWYSYKGTNVGQGTDKTIAWLENNKEVTDEIKAACTQKMETPHENTFESKEKESRHIDENLSKNEIVKEKKEERKVSETKPMTEPGISDEIEEL